MASGRHDLGYLSLSGAGDRPAAGSARVPAAVGPVLLRGPLTDVIIAAIRAHNRDVQVSDRGAYLRVQVPGRCLLVCADVAARVGRAFALPGDLEEVMPSWKGTMTMGDDQVIWQAGLGAPPGNVPA
jgi:hypothetical protein